MKKLKKSYQLNSWVNFSQAKVSLVLSVIVIQSLKIHPALWKANDASAIILLSDYLIFSK